MMDHTLGDAVELRECYFHLCVSHCSDFQTACTEETDSVESLYLGMTQAAILEIYLRVDPMELNGTYI